jgi:hypothetical protein
MKKSMSILSVTLLTLALAMAVYAQTKKSNPPDTKPGPCSQASFEPEVLSFYGDSAAVLKKLDEFEMNLPNRRVYMFMLESSGTAELSLFERKDDTNVQVAQWRGTSLAELREKISTGLLENRGIACVGEQTKSLVKAKLSPADMGAIPAPVSARAAFAHTIKKYGDNYIRVTVFLLC